nr:kinesin light chain 3 isoform X1 [Ipomoea batatas]
MAEDVSTPVSSNDANEAEIAGLQKIEDGSITSNIHTQKWRVFTDSGRDLFLQGKLEDAEKLFLAAIQEAKEGFGDRDSHVASACNNLAELYRVKKELDKAEPLYLEAISILEESFGHDDIRVGAALHNLGQFYLVQQNLEQARVCYELIVQIKRRVLGEAHPDYADTMYHLGTVLHFQGKEKDSETLIWDSIRILEDVGQGESIICTKRMRHLAEVVLPLVVSIGCFCETFIMQDNKLFFKLNSYCFNFQKKLFKYMLHRNSVRVTFCLRNSFWKRFRAIS